MNDIYSCDEDACSVADYFQMPALRTEALCVVCNSADVSHLPLLHNMVDTFNIDGLAPCVKALQQQQKEQQRMPLF